MSVIQEINDYQSRVNMVNMYYLRDIELNLNNQDTIRKALQKLGYYNIDIQTELFNSYLEALITKIRNELTSNRDSPIRNKTINEIMVYESNPALMYRFERANILAPFLTHTDTFDFYNNLTLEELNYLGY